MKIQDVDLTPFRAQSGNRISRVELLEDASTSRATNLAVRVIWKRRASAADTGEFESWLAGELSARTAVLRISNSGAESLALSDPALEERDRRHVRDWKRRVRPV